MQISSESRYSREELEAMIVKMQEASNTFYRAAAQIGNHAFIEFTGLMNEYIKICGDNLKDNRDFTQFNIHTRQPMIQPYQRDYMQEKIECIFGVSLEIKILDEAALFSRNLVP